MTEQMQLREMFELVRMKQKSPDEYKKFVKDLGEVTADVMESMSTAMSTAIRMAQKMSEEMEDDKKC